MPKLAASMRERSQHWKAGIRRLFETVRDNHITMCGVLPACIVLECLQQMGPVTRAEKVAYGTSADTSGDTSRVVGYAGMLFA